MIYKFPKLWEEEDILLGLHAAGCITWDEVLAGLFYHPDYTLYWKYEERAAVEVARER